MQGTRCRRVAHRCPLIDVHTQAVAVLRPSRIGSIQDAGPFRLGFGGSESNVAIGLVRLGHAARWVGRVGDDVLGRGIAAGLTREGVDVSDIVVDGQASTGLMIREDRSALTTTVHYVRRGSAGSRLVPEDVPPPATGDHLHITGITPALGAGPTAAIERAIDLAIDAGLTISFDVNHRRALWSREVAAPVLRHLAARATIVFASDDEVDLLGGDPGSDAAVAAALIMRGVTQVVVKRGRNGATGFRADGETSASGVDVPVVDPVGAGDAFVAGYLAAFLDGADLDACLAQAIRAGAYAITVPGDFEGMPTRADLDAMGGRSWTTTVQR